jgi:hypothetical protein
MNKAPAREKRRPNGRSRAGGPVAQPGEAPRARPEPFRNRIVGYGAEAPEQLLANPANWRIHPQAQQAALEAVLREVGWVRAVLVNRLTGFVIDGHLRVAMAISRGEPMVPVEYVELEPGEEAMILASLDPLAGMALTDPEQLAAVLGEVRTDDAGLQALLESLDVRDRDRAARRDEAEEGSCRICGRMVMTLDEARGILTDEREAHDGTTRSEIATDRAEDAAGQSGLPPLKS